MAYKPYTAISGDSLSKIAAANKTTVSALLDENPKFKTDPKYNGGKTIFSGTIVRIPIKSTAPSTPNQDTTTSLPPVNTQPSNDVASVPSEPDTYARFRAKEAADEAADAAAKALVPRFEIIDNKLYYAGVPYTGLYNGVQFIGGSDGSYATSPPESTLPPESIPPQQETPTQTPALDASNLVGVSTTAPVPVSIDPSFLLAYADALQKANTLRGRSALTRDLSIEKSAAMKEKNVGEADKALYNARLKALASLANRGIYGRSGLGVAAQQAAGYEPIQQRSEALRQFSEQTNLASRLFEQEQLEASDIEKQASLAKLRAEELASKLTKVGA